MCAAPLQKWEGSSAPLRTRRVLAFEEPAAQKGNQDSNKHDAGDDQKRAHPITGRDRGGINEGQQPAEHDRDPAHDLTAAWPLGRLA